MPVKVEVTNLSLAYLVEELKPFLEGGFVEKAQDLEKQWIKLRVRTKKTQHLIFSPNALLIAKYRVPAKQQSTGFGAFVRKRIEGKKLQSIKQHGFERIVSLNFGSNTLIAELFGEGNLLLLDENNKILKPLHKKKWSARTLASGEKYAFPPQRGNNPKTLTLTELCSVFKESDQDAIRALLSGVNVPPIIGEEVFARTNIKKSKPARDLSKKEMKKVHSQIRKFYSSVSLEEEKPTLAPHSDKRVLLPFEPVTARVLKEFDSINEALNQLFLLPSLKPEKKEKKQPNLKRAIREQKAALNKAVQSAELNERKAKLIYEHYPQLMRAVNELRKLSKQKKPQKDVMYNRSFGFVSVEKIDLKKKNAVFKVPE